LRILWALREWIEFTRTRVYTLEQTQVKARSE
jgi:hypothetical protein